MSGSREEKGVYVLFNSLDSVFIQRPSPPWLPLISPHIAKATEFIINTWG